MRFLYFYLLYRLDKNQTVNLIFLAKNGYMIQLKANLLISKRKVYQKPDDESRQHCRHQDEHQHGPCVGDGFHQHRCSRVFLLQQRIRNKQHHARGCYQRNERIVFVVSRVFAIVSINRKGHVDDALFGKMFFDVAD